MPQRRAKRKLLCQPPLESLEPRLLFSSAVQVVFGTASDDVIHVTITALAFTVSVDGSSQNIAFANASSLVIDGNGGVDQITVAGGPAAESIVFNPTGGTVTAPSYSLTIRNITTQQFNGAGGDTAWLYGSSGDDTFVGVPEYGMLAGGNFLSVAAGCDRVNAVATAGGHDVAYLYDSPGDDRFGSTPVYAYLEGAGFYNYVAGFSEVYASSTSGDDVATVFDSADDDRFGATPAYAYLTGPTFYDYTAGFGMVYAYATAGGNDVAALYGSAGDDRFGSTPAYGYLCGTGFYNYAGGFDYVYAYETAGNNVAVLYDSPGDDRFGATATYGYLTGAGFYDYAGGFSSVYGYATGGGNDEAALYDSLGDDQCVFSPAYVWLQADDSYCYAASFDAVYAYATAGGDDSATFYDSAGADTFTSTPSYAYITSAGYYGYAGGFARRYAYASAGGADAANFYGSEGSDTALVDTTSAVLFGSGYYSGALGFARNSLDGQGGTDRGYIMCPASAYTSTATDSGTMLTLGAVVTGLYGFQGMQAYIPNGMVDAGIGATVVDSSGVISGSVANALDGNAQDNTVSAEVPFSFRIGLGREVDIRRIDLVWGSASSYATAYKIEIVDHDEAVAYQTVVQEDGQVGQVQVIDCQGQSILAAYLRITVTQASTDQLVLRQVRVLGTEPTDLQSILLNPAYRDTDVFSADDPNNPLSVFSLPISLATQMAGEQILAGLGPLTDHQKIVAFMHVLDSARIGYGASVEPETTLLENIGACGAWTNVLVSLAATQGIPARIVGLYNYPYYPDTNTYDGHTVAELYVDNEWEVYDPTYGVYYTTDPTNQLDPHVLSFADLNAGMGSQPGVTRIVGNPERLAAGGWVAESFAGPEIYTAADPSGPIGPDRPMVFPLALDLSSKSIITAANFGANQGAWILGAAAYINVSQRFTLSGLVAGQTYMLTAAYSGSGGAVGTFLATSTIVGGTIISGANYAYQTSLGDANPAWSITFTADASSVDVLLTHSYTSPFYLYDSSYALTPASP